MSPNPFSLYFLFFFLLIFLFLASVDPLPTRETNEGEVNGTTGSSIGVDNLLPVKDTLTQKPREGERTATTDDGDNAVVYETKGGQYSGLLKQDDNAPPSENVDLDLDRVSKVLESTSQDLDLATKTPDNSEFDSKSLDLDYNTIIAKDSNLSLNDSEFVSKDLYSNLKDSEFPPDNFEETPNASSTVDSDSISKDLDLISKELDLTSKDLNWTSKELDLTSKDLDLASKEIDLTSKDFEIASKYVDGEFSLQNFKPLSQKDSDSQGEIKEEVIQPCTIEKEFKGYTPRESEDELLVKSEKAQEISENLETEAGQAEHPAADSGERTESKMNNSSSPGPKPTALIKYRWSKVVATSSNDIGFYPSYAKVCRSCILKIKWIYLAMDL